MRLSYEELNKVKEQYGVDELWSFSKFDCYRTSQYEWMLKYIKHLKPNAEIESCYGALGGAAHDLLEDFYEGKVKYEDMAEKWDDAFTMNIDVCGLKFDRSDEAKNKSIKEKYYYDIKHFFENYKPLNYKMKNEQFVTIKITDDIVMQGYIDAFYVDENKMVNIIDYKSSTAYKGDAIRLHCHQLLLYSEALRQKGVPKENIRAGWNFLKYVNIYTPKPRKVNLEWDTVKGEHKVKEGLDVTKIVSTLKASAKAWLKAEGYDKSNIDTYIENAINENSIYALPENVWKYFTIEELPLDNPPRQVERCKIGETMQANVKSTMKKLGYNEDDIFASLNTLALTNDMTSLPKDVQDMYIIEDCYIYVDNIWEMYEELKEEIIETVAEIRDKVNKFKELELTDPEAAERLFWDDDESLKAQSYYYNNLCDYNFATMRPFADYTARMKAEKEGGLLGGFVPSRERDYEDDTSSGNNVIEDLDLSWLESL